MLSTLLNMSAAWTQNPAATPAASNAHMLTTAGWAFMLVSVGGVFVWTAWCFYKVLTAPEANEAAPPPGYGP